MTIAFYCVFLAFLVNYLPKIPTAFAMYKLDNRYDNEHPRDQQSRLTGFGKRALSAHLNSFEIFPAFAVSVIISHLSEADPNDIDTLAIVFVVSRLVYIGLYLANMHLLRSTVWSVGFASVIFLFLLPIIG